MNRRSFIKTLAKALTAAHVPTPEWRPSVHPLAAAINQIVEYESPSVIGKIMNDGLRGMVEDGGSRNRDVEIALIRFAKKYPGKYSSTMLYHYARVIVKSRWLPAEKFITYPVVRDWYAHASKYAHDRDFHRSIQQLYTAIQSGNRGKIQSQAWDMRKHADRLGCSKNDIESAVMSYCTSPENSSNFTIDQLERSIVSRVARVRSKRSDHEWRHSRTQTSDPKSMRVYGNQERYLSHLAFESLTKTLVEQEIQIASSLRSPSPRMGVMFRQKPAHVGR